MRLSATLMTLNEENYIDLCIEQMYPHVDEILVIDGGSIDKTIDILKRYDKVKYYIIPQPTGRYDDGWNEGHRLNILKDAAKGKWLISCGCDELFDDIVWERLDGWLNNEDVIGYGFYRVNYYYNFNYHKPIHQPRNGGEVRIYRNLPGLYMETNLNDHNFRRYEGIRLYDHPKVVNTKNLIHHMHRIGLRGQPAVHDRGRNKRLVPMTEEYVKTQGFHRTADNNYFRPIVLPSILHRKGIVE